MGGGGCVRLFLWLAGGGCGRVGLARVGAVGSCVAQAAREVGAEVLVAERTSGAGGAAALSEGIVYLGGGTPVQIACGFEDSVDNMMRHLLAACGPERDEAKGGA